MHHFFREDSPDPPGQVGTLNSSLRTYTFPSGLFTLLYIYLCDYWINVRLPHKLDSVRDPGYFLHPWHLMHSGHLINESVISVLQLGCKLCEARQGVYFLSH